MNARENRGVQWLPRSLKLMHHPFFHTHHKVIQSHWCKLMKKLAENEHALPKFINGQMALIQIPYQPENYMSLSS